MNPDVLVDTAISAVAQHQPSILRDLAAGPLSGPEDDSRRLRQAVAALALTLTDPVAATEPVQAALAADPPSPDLQVFLLRSLYPPAVAMDGDLAVLERLRTLAASARHPRARAVGHRLAWERAYWHDRPAEAQAIAVAAIPDAGTDQDLALEFRARAFYGALAAYDFPACADLRSQLEPHEARLAGWGLHIRHGLDEMDLVLGKEDLLLRRAEDLRAAGDPGWAWSVLTWPLIHAALIVGRPDVAVAVVECLRGVDRRVGGMAPAMVAAHVLLGQIAIHIYHRRYREARALLAAAGQATRDLPTLHRALRILAVRLAWVDRDGPRMRAGLRQVDPLERAGDCALLHVLLDHCEGRLHQARDRLDRMRRSQPPSVVRLHLATAFELDACRVLDLLDAGRDAVRDALPVHLPAENGDHPLVGDDPAVHTVHQRIAVYALHDQPVLLTGETGTGKEIAARLLHRSGPRSTGPFLALNCASLTDSLAEAELFGHAKGAFTGAASDRAGLLAAAAAGSLFLDEVNSLPLRLQGLLMRVLETGDYRRVGDTRLQHSTARIIAASNEDLDAAVAAGRFRSDLFYRLSRLRIDLPPLRARRGDIPGLVRHILGLIAPGAAIAVAEDLEQALVAHPWPGNVRELRNVLERAVILARRPHLLTLADCPELLPPPSLPPSHPPTAPPAASSEPVVVPGSVRARERRRRILDLFAMHPHLYAVEAVRALGCAPRTCTADLQALAAAGLIRRVVTSANLATSYWIRC